MKHRFHVLTLIGTLALLGCSRQSVEIAELRRFPLDTLDDVIETDGIEIDAHISSDGAGALKVTATESRTIQLFEITPPLIDDARMIYRARLRTEGVIGDVYLELLCHIPGMGEFFSRGLDHPLTGDTDWSTEEVLFVLKSGETPDRVMLNVIINGSGTIWIDSVELLKAPLEI